MAALAKAAIRLVVPLTFAVGLVVLWSFGFNEQGTREALRATARISLLLFCLAFAARPLHQLVGRPATAWLLRERRTVGVCFGLSFSAHVLLIVRLFFLNGRLTLPEGVTVLDVVIGGPGIVLVGLMTITSAVKIRRAIPPHVWQRLHTFGLYYVWFVYTACLVNSASAKSHLYPAYHYVPFLALLCAVLLLRLTTAVQKLYLFRTKRWIEDGA